jgi:hypothetical protein
MAPHRLYLLFAWPVTYKKGEEKTLRATRFLEVPSGADIKSYTINKVQSAVIAEETLEPRFPIELAKSGGYFAKPYFSRSGVGTLTSRHTSRSSGLSLPFTLECPYCNKRFKRAKY